MANNLSNGTLPCFLVCLIKVDQRRGNLYWVSCDQNSIGTTTANDQYSHQLYQTTNKIRDLHLDWLRGGILWLEEDIFLTMSMMGSKAKELMHLPAGGVRGNIAFDLRANSLLWNSERTGRSVTSQINPTMLFFKLKCLSSCYESCIESLFQLCSF